MNVDLSQKEIEFILGRLVSNDDYPEPDEMLIHRLRRYSENREPFTRQYQQDFKFETPLPPLPQET
jgi:hypothetical protein